MREYLPYRFTVMRGMAHSWLRLFCECHYHLYFHYYHHYYYHHHWMWENYFKHWFIRSYIKLSLQSFLFWMLPEMCLNTTINAWLHRCNCFFMDSFFPLIHRNVLAKSKFLPEINRCQIRPFFVWVHIHFWGKRQFYLKTWCLSIKKRFSKCLPLLEKVIRWDFSIKQ